MAAGACNAQVPLPARQVARPVSAFCYSLCWSASSHRVFSWETCQRQLVGAGRGELFKRLGGSTAGGRGIYDHAKVIAVCGEDVAVHLQRADLGMVDGLAFLFVDTDATRLPETAKSRAGLAQVGDKLREALVVRISAQARSQVGDEASSNSRCSMRARTTRVCRPVKWRHAMLRSRSGRSRGSPIAADHIAFHAIGFHPTSQTAAGLAESCSTRRRTLCGSVVRMRFSAGTSWPASWNRCSRESGDVSTTSRAW
jgi:hypothetical protein